MLKIELDENEGIAILEPDGELSENDFKAAAGIIDPYIKNYGELKGMAIHVKDFPGWDSFGALVTHLKFIGEHHEKIARIAFVTDSPVGSIAEKIGSHFVKAKIKEFDFEELEAAKSWILSGET